MTHDSTVVLIPRQNKFELSPLKVNKVSRAPWMKESKNCQGAHRNAKIAVVMIP